MIPRSTRHISDGDNTTKRYSQNSQTRFNNIRVVLRDFPWEGKLETMKDIKHYLSGDRIQCLLCGKSYKMLATHIVRVHGVSVDNYKERYGIPWGRGLTCAATREKIVAHVTERIARGENPLRKYYLDPVHMRNAQTAGMTPRPLCPAVRKAQIKRGTKGLMAYSKAHPAKPKPLSKRATLWLKVDAYVKDARERGETILFMSMRLGVGKDVIKNSIKRLGLTSNPAAIKEKVLELHNKGYARKIIAKKVNRSIGRIHQIVNEVT